LYSLIGVLKGRLVPKGPFLSLILTSGVLKGRVSAPFQMGIDFDTLTVFGFPISRENSRRLEEFYGQDFFYGDDLSQFDPPTCHLFFGRSSSYVDDDDGIYYVSLIDPHKSTTFTREQLIELSQQPNQLLEQFCTQHNLPFEEPQLYILPHVY
jgi:hypothetical protein